MVVEEILRDFAEDDQVVGEERLAVGGEFAGAVAALPEVADLGAGDERVDLLLRIAL